METQKLISSLKNACGGPEGISMCKEAANVIETLQAELKQSKAERDAAIKDIDGILAKAELIRRKIGYCLDYDSDAELASLCIDYCKNNVCEMCYEEREDGGCNNFLWRNQKEN